MMRTVDSNVHEYKGPRCDPIRPQGYPRAHFERKDSLAIMDSMILSKHLERTWPSIHLLGEPISKSRSGMH